MRFDVITLFPDMFVSFSKESIIKRAIGNKFIELKIHQLRSWAKDKYKTVDDKPFGGGVGMLLKPDVLYNCLSDLKKITSKIKKQRVVVLSARGKRFTQKDAERLTKYDQIILVCGHYEGIDARFEDNCAHELISIGDFVVTGGELPAMLVIEAISRLKKGVLGKDRSSEVESFSKLGGKRLREYRQYTRPRMFLGYEVPNELVSGDPKKIASWQKREQQKK